MGLWGTWISGRVKEAFAELQPKFASFLKKGNHFAYARDAGSSTHGRAAVRWRDGGMSV